MNVSPIYNTNNSYNNPNFGKIEGLKNLLPSEKEAILNNPFFEELAIDLNKKGKNLVFDFHYPKRDSIEGRCVDMYEQGIFSSKKLYTFKSTYSVDSPIEHKASRALKNFNRSVYEHWQTRMQEQKERELLEEANESLKIKAMNDRIEQSTISFFKTIKIGVCNFLGIETK